MIARVQTKKAPTILAYAGLSFLSVIGGRILDELMYGVDVLSEFVAHGDHEGGVNA